MFAGEVAFLTRVRSNKIHFGKITGEFYLQIMLHDAQIEVML
jgi:hypothetical protein